ASISFDGARLIFFLLFLRLNRAFLYLRSIFRFLFCIVQLLHDVFGFMELLSPNTRIHSKPNAVMLSCACSYLLEHVRKVTNTASNSVLSDFSADVHRLELQFLF